MLWKSYWLLSKNDERILIVNFQWYFFKKIFLNHNIFFQIQCYIMKEKLFICYYCRKTIKESQPFNSQFSIINIFCNRCDLSKNIWNVIRETFCFIIHSYESFLFFDSTIGRFEFGKVKHRGIWSCNGSFLEKFGCLCASTNVVLWVALISCFRNLLNIYLVNCLSREKLYLVSN